jgi:hypothetical protein
LSKKKTRHRKVENKGKENADQNTPKVAILAYNTIEQSKEKC